MANTYNNEINNDNNVGLQFYWQAIDSGIEPNWNSFSDLANTYNNEINNDNNIGLQFYWQAIDSGVEPTKSISYFDGILIAVNGFVIF